MHFLLADDLPTIRKLFTVWFRLADHTVRMVENGEEAVAAVEQEVFDAIILDLDMPVVSGWDALQRIRQLPNGQSVPIGIISGAYDRAEMQPTILQGADAVFAKPLDPHEILTTMEELVSRSREKPEF